MDDSTLEELLADTKGRYEFIRELGRGGMGIVYLARDLELGRLVAAKVLSPTLLADEGMVERFRREARTIASMRHESIVTVYGVGRAGSLHYFVMDFIEGTSLSKVLRVHGPLPIPVVKAILFQVGSALGYAHRPRRGIVHRDVKPSNILLDFEGHAVVMDFGIAKVSESAGGLTRTGVFMGTPEYMSPEQCRQHTVTPQTDQYALGAVVYAMLTGAPPFTGPWYRVALAHEADPIPSILVARPDCPPELAQATERMLAKSPGDRWEDIATALKALGLMPLAADDPVREEIAALVRSTTEASRASDVAQASTGGSVRTATGLRIANLPQEGVEEGDQLRLTASVLFDDGTEEDGSSVEWGSTDPAVVDVDPHSGEFVAVGVGSVEITARAAGVVGSVPLEVSRPQVVQIEIDPTDLALVEGETAQFNAHPKNKKGTSLDRPVTWSSSDPRTLKVTASGSVKAMREGVANVLAVCEGTGSSARVEVSAAEATDRPQSGSNLAKVAEITIFPPPTGLAVGDTFALIATARDSDGRPLERELIWSVADTAVLEGLGGGGFRVVGVGETEVSVEADGVTQKVSVAVRGAVQAVAVASSEPASGEKVLATESPPAPRAGRAGLPRVIPANARRALYVVAPILVVIILYAFWPSAGGSVDRIEIRGAEGSVLGSGVTMRVNESVLLSRVILAEDGSELDRAVVWQSSDSAVAWVDDGGTLWALAAGTASITALVGGARSPELAVSVQEPVSEIAIRDASSGQRLANELRLDSGEVRTLSARALDGAGAELSDRPIDWRLIDSTVISLRRLSNSDAEVTARASGGSLLVADAEGIQEQLTVEVLPVSTPGGGRGGESTPRQLTGLLRMRAGPRAIFYVNGVQQNQEAQSTLELRLPPGSYRLRFEGSAGSGFLPIEMLATVVASDTVDVVRQLRRESGR